MPRTAVVANETRRERQAGEPSVSVQTVIQPLAGCRAVICEDEAVTQMQLRRALLKAGAQVVGIATNGQEAIEITLRERPDLVLMDVRMPRIDGIAATAQIREAYNVCVVMITAFSSGGFEERARSLGVTDYIVKPITSDRLIPLLTEALRRFYESAAPHS